MSRFGTNRVITVGSSDVFYLDRKVSELLDIIDKYGGTNPYPRFLVTSPGYVGNTIQYFYSCTTKIPNDSVKDFDIEIFKFRGRENDN